MFDAFATTGGTPSASRVGKLTREPVPTIVLIVPAAAPASSTVAASQIPMLPPVRPGLPLHAVAAVCPQSAPRTCRSSSSPVQVESTRMRRSVYAGAARSSFWSDSWKAVR